MDFFVEVEPRAIIFFSYLKQTKDVMVKIGFSIQTDRRMIVIVQYVNSTSKNI